jgi:sec-independent protein translocase protein TatC
LENSKLPLKEHLSELRKRILISVAVLFTAFFFIFNYSEELFNILVFPLKSEIKLDVTNPYIHIIHKTPVSLVFLAPAEAFWMHMKVSFLASLIFVLPVIFYQLWKFISPGLLAKEKKYLIPFLLALQSCLSGSFLFVIILPLL